jgi:AcrR family transcriptional regulator
VTTTTPPSARRGEYAKSAQRRKEIIAAAVEVFSESGYRDGSLRQVADRAGITHAGMRHHFPTKVDLLEGVLQWRADESLLRASQDHPEGLAALRTWVRAVGENTKRPALIELEITLAAEATAADHPAHEYFEDLYRRGLEILQRAFAVAERRKQLRDDLSPELAARLFLAATTGLQSIWLRYRSVNLADDLRAELQALITVDVDTDSGTERA